MASTTPPERVNGGQSGGEPGGPGQRTRSAPYPRYTLRQVEDLTRKAFEMGPRHCDQDQVAGAVGYKNATNGAFKGLRAAGGYFGLITYEDDQHLSVSEPWISALHEDDSEELKRLRIEAMQTPVLYRQLIEEYQDRQLPATHEKLARTLHINAKYGILKDAADAAARTFLESASYAGMVDANNYLRPKGVEAGAPASSSGPIATRTVDGNPSTDAQRGDQPTGNTTVGSSPPPAPAPFAPAGDALDRLEVQLTGGRRAYLYVPVPLASNEKDRLKKYIDLILEPDTTETPPAAGQGSAGAISGSQQQ